MVKSPGFAIISVNNWYSFNKTEIATQKIMLSLINKLDNGTEIRHTGPSLILINQPALNPSGKKLGIKVGLPIVIAAAIAAGILLLCLRCRKKRRGAVANIMGGRPNYLSKGSRSQRIPAAGGGFSLNENDASAAPSKSHNRFQDYPGGGGSVELQDRTRRNDGNAFTSPTRQQDGFGDVRPTRNVFRDEIGRQRGREPPPVEDFSDHQDGGRYDAWR